MINNKFLRDKFLPDKIEPDSNQPLDDRAFFDLDLPEVIEVVPDLPLDLPTQNKERVRTRDISFEEAKKGGNSATARRIMEANGFTFNIGSLKNNGTWSRRGSSSSLPGDGGTTLADSG